MPRSLLCEDRRWNIHISNCWSVYSSGGTISFVFVDYISGDNTIIAMILWPTPAWPARGQGRVVKRPVWGSQSIPAGRVRPLAVRQWLHLHQPPGYYHSPVSPPWRPPTCPGCCWRGADWSGWRFRTPPPPCQGSPGGRTDGWPHISSSRYSPWAAWDWWGWVSCIGVTVQARTWHHRTLTFSKPLQGGAGSSQSGSPRPSSPRSIQPLEQGQADQGLQVRWRHFS